MAKILEFHPEKCECLIQIGIGSDLDELPVKGEDGLPPGIYTCPYDGEDSQYWQRIKQRLTVNDVELVGLIFPLPTGYSVPTFCTANTGFVYVPTGFSHELLDFQATKPRRSEESEFWRTVRLSFPWNIRRGDVFFIPQPTHFASFASTQNV